MKVVLFCGGMGMRLRDHADSTPKPMVTIGYRPILWHIMKYYAHFGHKDFILCLGWKADVVKQYFLNYDECLTNDFVLSAGGANVDLISSDIHDWRITCVDSGIKANIGQRLKAIEPYVAGEEVFLANYTDGLSDLHLPDLIDVWRKSNSIATFLSVRPTQSFHAVNASESGVVERMAPIGNTDVWMNGGFFVMSPEIFDYLEPGDELVEKPFDRIMAIRRLTTLKYSGFWSCMDTFKEKQMLDDMVVSGDMPWEVWKSNETGRSKTLNIGTGVPVISPNSGMQSGAGASLN